MVIPQSTKNLLRAVAFGNILEFYAFTLFGFYVPVISQLFFPSENAIASLLYGYLLFAVGFLTYPLGAIVFGYIGDIYGRKVALTISIIAMAISTTLIGILPTYEQVGLAAPLALCFCRIVQGICAGGEYIGSGLIIVEHMSKDHPGFFGSVSAASGTLGALIAALIGVIFTLPMMPEWAWRIPFLIGVVLGYVGFYFRRKVEESPEFKFISHDKYSIIYNHPLWGVFKDHVPSLLCAIGIGAFGTVPFYFVIGYLNASLVSIGKIDYAAMMILNAFILFFCASTLPLIGYFADKVGHNRLMIGAAIASMVYAYPFSLLIQMDSLVCIICAQMFFLLLSQGYVAPINAFMAKLFPSNFRYSGAALGYCIGMAMLGGTTPYFSVLFVQWNGNKTFVSIYLFFISFLGMIAVIKGHRIIQQADS